ncbi:MAG TPA: hypothetical protein VGZ69_01590 [Candidatus Rhabdochlamydia sp.]|jgi:hypothetical protein|nr:hypothetical protein [Candidatus Rhabdochlamydia sp.]
MQTLSQKLEKNLIDLAWSLWTELGVAGVIRNHQQFLIMPEELILLTAVLAKSDPRLRDEALDWCSRNHHFISISRLRTLIKSLGKLSSESYAVFAATLNSVTRAHWPCVKPKSVWKFVPSAKSHPPQFTNAALLLFRLRALFGVGARADLLLFFFMQEKNDFSISDTTEIGYAKRSLADVLENFVRAGIFDVFFMQNQKRYSFTKRNQLIKMLQPLPKHMPPWTLILEVILKLRFCIQYVENKSNGTKIVEIQNMLMDMTDQLRKLKLNPPPMQLNFQAYWDSFSEWILEISKSLAAGQPGMYYKID